MSALECKELSDWYAPVVIGIGLIGILALHLVPAYFAGLAMFFVVRKTAKLIPPVLSRKLKHWVALFGVLIVVICSMTLLILWAISNFHSAMTEHALIKALSLGWERLVSSVPTIIGQYLPASFGNLMDDFADLIGAHWDTIGAVSSAGFLGLILAIVGLVVGALIAFEPPQQHKGPFKKLTIEIDRAARAFWEVLSAQAIISLVNTLLTGVYLLALLPLFKVNLPYSAVLIIVTFVTGLLPVLGNLISNTLLVLISFTISPHVALASLVFLLIVHQFEYFLDAKIIAMKIQAKPWELLIAFFVADAAFGLAGFMVAPFFYGYYKLLVKERINA